MLCMLAPTVSCSMIEDMFDNNSRHGSRSSKDRDRDDDDDDEDEDEDEDEDDEDETEETEETTEETEPSETTEPDDQSDLVDGFDMTDLTYPDHVPTYDELHPAHTTGTVSGDDASQLLDQVEHDIIQRAVGDSYVDYEILFADPTAQGYVCNSVSWGIVDSDTD